MTPRRLRSVGLSNDPLTLDHCVTQWPRVRAPAAAMHAVMLPGRNVPEPPVLRPRWIGGAFRAVVSDHRGARARLP